jgi:hypothetical protein
VKFEIDPPIEILAVLLKEGERKPEEADRSRMDRFMVGRGATAGT